MILCNYFTLWWKKEPDFDVSDDIRFVIAHYGRSGGPWIARRLVYKLARRTGIAFRTNSDAPWIFFGVMTLSERAETNEPSGRAALNEEAGK
ncbi:hypothetical protein [Rhizobium sp. No.120]